MSERAPLERHDRPVAAVGWTEAAARVSGLVAVVAVGALVALTQVVDDPARDTVPATLERWDRPGWRVLECVVLLAAAAHVPSTVALALRRRGSPRQGLWVALVTATSVAIALFGCAVVVTAPL